METALAIATICHAIISSHYRRGLPESSVVGILNSIYLQGGLYYIVSIHMTLKYPFLLYITSKSIANHRGPALRSSSPVV
jgi:hypothetical protein